MFGSASERACSSHLILQPFLAEWEPSMVDEEGILRLEEQGLAPKGALAIG